MQPANLNPELFAGYPPEARKLVLAHLDAIRKMPLSFVPNLLREAIDYDFKFPAERLSITKELDALSALTDAEREEWFKGFAQITLAPALEKLDWVNEPVRFGEQESAHLWSTHQQDAFREAATEYGTLLHKTAPPREPAAKRLGIAVIGQGVTSYSAPLFRNLRPHGTYFSSVKPDNGLPLLIDAVRKRASVHPEPYAHWYVDGGEEAEQVSQVTCVSYKGMEGLRSALLREIQHQILRPGMGPVELNHNLAGMKPADFGIEKGDPVMNRFQLKVLTEGSGTQIFSTTFAQWSAREALRRAQPLTLLVRFAPRQRQRPMNDLLSDSPVQQETDSVGSLVDADMGAYYHWINQQRLPGATDSVFVAWFEGHQQAVAISPHLPRGVESSSAMDLGDLLQLALS